MSKINCCVPQCSSVKWREKDLSFHRFPMDLKLRKRWTQVLKMGKEPSSRLTVCSRHFEETNFYPDGPKRKLRKLKIGVVPSKCLPVSSVNTTTARKTDQILKSSNRYETINRKRQENSEWLSVPSNEITVAHDSLMNVISSSNGELEVAQILLAMSGNANDAVSGDFPFYASEMNNVQPAQVRDIENNAKLWITVSEEFPVVSHNINNVQPAQCVLDKSIQVNTIDFLRPRLNLLDLSDYELNTLTGVHTNALLMSLVKCIKEKLNPKNRRITLRECVILTMMRIKLNLKFVVLSIFFGLSPSSCKDIFAETVILLAKVLQSVIHWPEKEEIMANLPKCFSSLDGIRVVIDCTEIPVCKPKCLTCSLMLYSHYKGRTTLKYMVSISPGGIITNISLGYGGRASDRSIFEQSSLLHQLEPHIDKVLVDKGFLIDEVCSKSYIEIKRPPFVKNGKLTAKEARETRTIARARVHVERVIQRLKVFSLLNSQVPWALVSHFDFVMIIVAGLTNLQSPILADDKFNE